METKVKEEPELEKVQVISPSFEELRMLELEGYMLYAIKDDIYYFNRWVIR